MATLSDLRAAIAQLVGELLYPGGVPAGSNPPSPVAGVPVCVFQGWPERGAVDADLAAGLVNVSVYAQGGGVNTSRYPVEDVPIALTPPTLSWTIAGTEATLAGTVATPQNVGLLVDGRAYLYGVQAGDTPASIAASLAALVAAVQPASATGPVVSIPGSRSIIGRAGGTATTLREVGRQTVVLEVAIWAPSEASRNAVGSAIEPGLRDIRRLPLPDRSIAMVRFVDVADSDVSALAGLYPRTMRIEAEYASTVTGSAAQILSFAETIGTAQG